ncbi:protein translocase subunit SecD [Sneathiella sp.]|uniref:protein translocase subunit SecD n=1 Tax=Sneathiella sp. TaxID=1964365 RepID=UPI0025E64B78|nr:protein translocase subunit SecD [Sneathiella sp.]
MWKIIVVLLVCAFGVIYTLPNFVSKSSLSGLPDWLPTKQLNLGLDLQGGSHLLLQVDAGAVKLKMMESLVDAVRDSLRQQGDNVGYRDLKHDSNVISFTLRDPADEAKARERLADLSNIMPNGQRDVVISFDEGGLVTLTPSEAAITARLSAAVDQSIEIVRRRVDETGVNEPNIQRQGQDRILVQLPGVDDPDRVKRLLGETAQLTFHLVDLTADLGAAGRVPPGSKRLPAIEEDGRSYVVKNRVMVSGENLEDAQATYQQGQPVVSIRFDGLGAKQFGRATSENVGKPFAIVLDNKVVSAPRINEPILGGSAVITGGFDVAGAQDLALLLRAGALPAPLDILEERSVGPDLGADSIAAGEIAGIIGIVAVAIFMIAYYGLFGVFANISLAINIFLIMAVLSVLGATLTLPGIAGIVLTIGMAVDANVLIFERIREEIRVGKTPLNAVESGFNRAFTTIIDANVTTALAAVILFVMGTGPIKGFAVTLLIGILSSMFTAILLTRMLVEFWLQRKRPKALEI